MAEAEEALLTGHPLSVLRHSPLLYFAAPYEEMRLKKP
jgi:hypothetical protein